MKVEKEEQLFESPPHSQEAAKDFEINEKNFDVYFFDSRLYGPKPGQVLASYTAVAEFADGPEKRQIIEFLKFTDKVNAAVQVMKKSLMAKDPFQYSVLREMSEDLLSGKTVEEIARKPYKFQMEMCFWTHPEYIPTDDPHWACVSIMNLEEHLTKKKEQDGISITAKIVEN